MKNEILAALNNTGFMPTYIKYNNREYRFRNVTTDEFEIAINNETILNVNCFTNKAIINIADIKDAGFAATVLDAIFN